jgi:hypothetical protein
VTPYWLARKDAVYLAAAQQICQRFCPGPRSVLDVGSNGTPILEWFRGAHRLTSVDIHRPYEAPGIESACADFLEWAPGEHFELVTCLQVLEHVPEPERFARKLLDSGSIVVASVPYKWGKRACREHIHDPVDETKMLSWFGREPAHSQIATEPHGIRRLIQVYR